MSTVAERISVNAVYYQANYLLIIGAAVLVTLTQSTRLALAAAVVTAGALALFVVRSDAVIINGRAVSERALMMAYAAVAVAALFYVDGGRIVTSLAAAAVLVLAHAVLRKRSVAAHVSVGVSQLSSRLR